MDTLSPTGHWIVKPLDCKATRLQSIPFQTCELSHTRAENAAREAVLKDLAVVKEFELKEKTDRDRAVVSPLPQPVVLLVPKKDHRNVLQSTAVL